MSSVRRWIIGFLVFIAIGANAGSKSLNDDSTEPIGVGLLTWSDKVVDFEPGVYGQICFLNSAELLRLNLGAAFSFHEEMVHVAAITSITVDVSGIEVGMFYAPFWGLDKRGNDPWGFMVGYLF